MKPSWLYQRNDRVAHAYPPDGVTTVAACDHALREQCDHCGRDEDVDAATPATPRCPKCLEIVNQPRGDTQ